MLPGGNGNSQEIRFLLTGKFGRKRNEKKNNVKGRTRLLLGIVRRKCIVDKGRTKGEAETPGRVQRGHDQTELAHVWKKEKEGESRTRCSS